MTTSQINNTIDYLVKTISWAEMHPSPDLFINIRHKLNELRQEVDDAIRSEVTATLIELASTGDIRQRVSVLTETRLPTSQKL